MIIFFFQLFIFAGGGYKDYYGIGIPTGGAPILIILGGKEILLG